MSPEFRVDPAIAEYVGLIAIHVTATAARSQRHVVFLLNTEHHATTPLYEHCHTTSGGAGSGVLGGGLGAFHATMYPPSTTTFMNSIELPKVGHVCQTISPLIIWSWNGGWNRERHSRLG